MMKTLVIVRGWASVEHSFKKFVNESPKDWKIEMIGADQLLDSFDFEQAADLLDEHLQQKKLNNFILAGHSLGGALAIVYAAKYPNSYSRLILVNPVGSPLPGIFLKEAIKMLFRNSHKALKQWPLKFREGVNLVKKPQFHLKLGKFAREANVVSHAGKIIKPVLILYGNSDKLIPAKVALEIHKTIPSSKLKILTGLDHDWIQLYPDIFWQEIKQVSG